MCSSDLAYMTALQLGEQVDVSESTVVRFAMNLGYEGYPHMQRALQETVRNRLTSLQRMAMTSDMSSESLVSTILRADVHNVRSTLDDLNFQEFENIVERICGARRIYLLGVRSAAPLAQFMGYYLNYVLDNVRVVTSGVSDVLEQLVHIAPEDVIIGMSFPRYSQRTLDAMRYAHARGVCTIALTDSPASPLAHVADHVILTRCNISSFVDSLVAPFSMANALITAVALRNTAGAAHNFAELEHIWDSYNVYSEKTTQSL